MDEQEQRAAKKHQDQIEALRKELEETLDTLQKAGTPASAKSRANQRIQRLRNRLARKQRDYAVYRLRHALGPDPLYIDDETLSGAIRYLIGSGRLADLGRDESPSRISGQARQELLLSNFSFAESLGSGMTRREDLMALLNPRSLLKDAFCQWASMLNDEFIKGTQKQLDRLNKNFENTVALFRRRIDHLRRRYEEQSKQTDTLELVRMNDRLMIRVGHFWANIADAFPDAVRQIFGIFRSLEEQVKEIEEIKEGLNQEIRRFMAATIPLYLALIKQQTRRVRRFVLGSHKPTIALAKRMMLEARQVDYLRKGSGLAAPTPRIPKEFLPVRHLAAYRKFKESASIKELRDAETVEFPMNR